MTLRNRSRFWAGVVTAWLLALQAASGGAAARPALFDPLAVFCAHDGAHPSPAPPPPLRRHDACCLASCVAAMVPPVLPATVPPRPALAAAVPGARRSPDAPDGRRPTSSATIRGPPGAG